MNEKIRELKNKLQENKKEKEELQRKLLNEFYEYLKLLGIENGTKVRVINHKTPEYGLFSHLELKYDNEAQPVIMKIKKDGTAHNTATIYCFNIKDLSKA